MQTEPKEKKYWFRPKNYGYGLEPISWEGWIMTLILIAVMLANGYSLGLFNEETINQQIIIKFVVDATIMISIFMLYGIKKTKGELKWYWGDRDDLRP